MNISRRVFVSNAAAAAALQAFAAPAATPRLRFGLISDIHLSRSRPTADRVFRPALEWFRDQGVDAVVCTGDLATSGFLAELENVSRTWFDVFPEDPHQDKMMSSVYHEKDRTFFLQTPLAEVYLHFLALNLRTLRTPST